jgi:hypothetical protein
MQGTHGQDRTTKNRTPSVCARERDSAVCQRTQWRKDFRSAGPDALAGAWLCRRCSQCSGGKLSPVSLSRGLSAALLPTMYAAMRRMTALGAAATGFLIDSERPRAAVQLSRRERSFDGAIDRQQALVMCPTCRRQLLRGVGPRPPRTACGGRAQVNDCTTQTANHSCLAKSQK